MICTHHCVCVCFLFSPPQTELLFKSALSIWPQWPQTPQILLFSSSQSCHGAHVCKFNKRYQQPRRKQRSLMKNTAQCCVYQQHSSHLMGLDINVFITFVLEWIKYCSWITPMFWVGLIRQQQREHPWPCQNVTHQDQGGIFIPESGLFDRVIALALTDVFNCGSWATPLWHIRHIFAEKQSPVRLV